MKSWKVLGSLLVFWATFAHGASTSPVVGDTLCLRVDKSSFPVAIFNNFALMGRLNDGDLFHNTYIVKITTDTDSWYSLKITPQTQNEINFLMSRVGLGVEVLWISREDNGLITPKVDYTDTVPITKYQVSQ